MDINKTNDLNELLSEYKKIENKLEQLEKTNKQYCNKFETILNILLAGQSTTIKQGDIRNKFKLPRQNSISVKYPETEDVSNFIKDVYQSFKTIDEIEKKIKELGYGEFIPKHPSHPEH